jgi:hypothetical protein
MEYAQQAKDVAAMSWAVQGLLSRDWPVGQQEIHDWARKGAAELAATLAKDGRTADAEQVAKAAAAHQQRDLRVRLTWQGEADLDLIVMEPIGTECSFRARQTPGGGTLQGDLASELRSETYSAAQAFPGEFNLTVRRVWGRPVGSKATLEIIRHQGTPQEQVQRETLTLDREQTFTVKLDSGRRTTMEEVPALDIVRQALQTTPTEAQASVEEQLRGLAAPITVGVDSGRMRGGIATNALRPSNNGSGDRPVLERLGQGGEEIHQQGVGAILNTGVTFTATAVVSPDRRYVNLQLNPVLSQVLNGRPNIPGIPGGN